MQEMQETGNRFNPWVRKISWSRKWQPTSVFLPRKFHGQRSLAGYSLWGCKELNMTEHVHIHCCKTATFLPVPAVILGIWSSDLSILIQFWTMIQWIRISQVIWIYFWKKLDMWIVSKKSPSILKVY